MISLFVGGVGCVRQMKSGLLLAGIRINVDQKSSPRRIYNGLFCGLGSFGFNSSFIVRNEMSGFVIKFCHTQMSGFVTCSFFRYERPL